jgi:hypothetical protein
MPGSLPKLSTLIGDIENSLHYVLDASFGKDGSRMRKAKGSENMAILRKVALTAARGDTETTSSIIGQREQAAWSNEYLEQLLFQSPFASVQDNLYALALR